MVCAVGEMPIGSTVTIRIDAVPVSSGSIVNQVDASLYEIDLDGELRSAVGMNVLPPPPDPFIDDDSRVFEADIAWMAAMGITKGCNPPTNDRYCPDTYVTRGEMAAFLTRALRLVTRWADPFVDDDGSIFEAEIERLAAAGVTRGCNPPDNTLFCPDDFVTRGQMAAFLHRALGERRGGATGAP